MRSFSIYMLFFIFLAGENHKSLNSVQNIQEPRPEINLSKDKKTARIVSRNPNFLTVLLDSSKNGYGAFLEVQSPLAYSFDACNDGANAGWVAAYRQFGTIDQTAGFLGVAKSDPTGAEWEFAPKINTDYPENQTYGWNGTIVTDSLPTPDGAPGARYPNAVISSWQNKATAVWNEYTLSTYGGGESGGVPMYAYDNYPLGFPPYFSAILHLNDGCANQAAAGEGTTCDPPDLWQANVQLVDGSDGNNNCNALNPGKPRLLAMYTGWAADPVYGETYPKYMIRSFNLSNGYINAHSPKMIQQDSLDSDEFGNCVWLNCGTEEDGGTYISTPDFHVNPDGIGYITNTGFVADTTNPPYAHTIFFRKTEDYGETWSGDLNSDIQGGYKNSGYFYLSDAELMDIHDSLLTLWSTYPDIYDDKPWYPWAVDSLGNVVGDTINYSDDTTEFGEFYDWFYTSSYFIGYQHDVVTDQDGGIHFTALAYPYFCKDLDSGCEDIDGDGWPDSIRTDTRFPGAGMYHYYNSDPIGQPDNWRVSFIEDLSTTFNLNFPETGPMALYSSPQFYFTPNIRPSYEEGSQVLWYASSNVSSFTTDSILGDVPTDLDIYMAKSVDNGKTWTKPENVTTTAGLSTDNHIEYGHHLANIGSDDEIGLFYQMADFSRLTVTDGENDWMDYVNYVYFLKYTNDLEYLSTGIEIEKDIIPNSFVLNQNYPNPFNPITNISYGIDKASNVKLSLYDVRGSFIETLINERIGAGNHDFMFDASHLSSGVYFYRMTVDGSSKTRKLVLMK